MQSAVLSCEWRFRLNLLGQGSSISGPRAKSGPRRPNNWAAEQRQNADEIYYNFFKVHLSVLTIYLFILIINERESPPCLPPNYRPPGPAGWARGPLLSGFWSYSN